jgi:hypothetical protein
MMSQQVVGSSTFGQPSTQSSFANSQIINQNQLGIFKAGGPIKATSFGIDNFTNLNSGSGQMLARKGISGSSKQYKRGQGSLGPSVEQGIRPGTA